MVILFSYARVYFLKRGGGGAFVSGFLGGYIEICWSRVWALHQRTWNLYGLCSL